nr:27 kDa glycoprotein-like [Onthophagus taurus]
MGDYNTKKIVFVILSALITIQLVTCKATPLSEDLLEVNNNQDQEQAQFSEQQKRFKEKCVRAYGNEDAFSDMQEVRLYLSECVSDIFYNASVLGNELITAYENGSLKQVLMKYCDMKEDFVRCFSPFMKNLEKCMENEDEIKFVRVGMRFIKSVTGHVCYHNGQRTRDLIENGGFQCIDEKTTDVLGCFHSTKSLKTMFQSVYDNAFVFEEQKCMDVINYEKCVIDKLKDCNSTSAIDFHNNLFKAIKRVLPCDFSKSSNLM